MRIKSSCIYTHTLCIRIKSGGNYIRTLCISINSGGYYTHTPCVYVLFEGNNGHIPCLSTVFKRNNKQSDSISILFNRKNYPAYCLSVASDGNKTQTRVNKSAGQPTSLPRAGMRWQGTRRVCRGWGCVGRAADRSAAVGDALAGQRTGLPRAGMGCSLSIPPLPHFSTFAHQKNGSNKWRY